jgi:hypothetical protein
MYLAFALCRMHAISEKLHSPRRLRPWSSAASWLITRCTPRRKCVHGGKCSSWPWVSLELLLGSPMMSLLVHASYVSCRMAWLLILRPEVPNLLIVQCSNGVTSALDCVQKCPADIKDCSSDILSNSSFIL